jgi:hypothetical protein
LNFSRCSGLTQPYGVGFSSQPKLAYPRIARLAWLNFVPDADVFLATEIFDQIAALDGRFKVGKELAQCDGFFLGI